jgi:hypothetical protein
MGVSLLAVSGACPSALRSLFAICVLSEVVAVFQLQVYQLRIPKNPDGRNRG